MMFIDGIMFVDQGQWQPDTRKESTEKTNTLTDRRLNYAVDAGAVTAPTGGFDISRQSSDGIHYR